MIKALKREEYIDTRTMDHLGLFKPGQAVTAGIAAPFQVSMNFV